MVPLSARVDLGAMALKVIPHSPKLQHYSNLNIRSSSVTFRTLIGGVSPLCICILKLEPNGKVSGRPVFNPKTLKMVPNATLLNTQRYKVKIKGKVKQFGEWSSTLSYTSVL